MNKRVDIDIKRKIFNEFAVGGITVSELAKKFGIPQPAVWRYTRGLYMKNVIPGKKYTVDENYFETISSEEKSYWLGFLYADGCVCRHGGHSYIIQFSQKIADKNHVEFFKTSVMSNHPIRESKTHLLYKGVVKTYTQAVISIYSKKMFDDLVSHGCVPAKSLVLDYPSFLRKDLVRHFIRGYIDGDGSISKNKHQKNGFTVGIMGTELFLLGMQSDLLSAHGIKSYLHPKGRMFYLTITRQEDVLKLRDVLYKNAKVFLGRKKAIFDLAKPNPNCNRGRWAPKLSSTQIFNRFFSPAGC